MSLIRPDRQMQELTESPRQAVARVQSISEARELHDRARVLHAALRKVEESRAQQNYFAEVALRAARECGERLLQLQLAIRRCENLKRGTERSQVTSSVPSLNEVGISKDQSSRFQKIARIDNVLFERYLQETKENGHDISVQGLHRYVKSTELTPQGLARDRTEQAGPFDPLLQANVSFATIFIDARGLEHLFSQKRVSVLIRQLRNAPVADLAKSNCHLHLALGDSLFTELGGLLRNWGFTVHGSAAWSRPAPGRNWPIQAELLLVTVRGDLPFQQDPQSVEFFDPTGKVIPEEALFEMVRLLSPGPYLRVSLVNGTMAITVEEETA